MGKFENEITVCTVCTNDEILIQKNGETSYRIYLNLRDSKYKLKILIENIIKYHFNEPLKNEEINNYIWQNDYLSKEKFVDKVINQKF